jgi:hypothetical protein
LQVAIQNLRQRGFPGPVPADQAYFFPIFHIAIHITQHLQITEALAYVTAAYPWHIHPPSCYCKITTKSPLAETAGAGMAAHFIDSSMKAAKHPFQTYVPNSAPPTIGETRRSHFSHKNGSFE